ncbi:MAG: DNA mismatch repair endonuclease MutL [Rickettsiales bacterium]
MKVIKLLSDKTINQIAAGEVVDRPISVIKELVENSIDAGATEIIVRVERGGRNLISIADNGSGITKDELPIALKRHATSKLDEADINNITHFGFRGEALPSIASIAKMKIITKHKNATDAWQIEVIGGETSSVIPVARAQGTTIEVRDIFCFTPARLKFLKSEKSENSAAIDLMQKFALANPEVVFKLYLDEKLVLDINPKNFANLRERAAKILGKEFIENALEFSGEITNIKIHGLAGVPTYNKQTAAAIHTFVNGRPIRDKIIHVALKTAYQNLIPSGRFPAVLLFIEINPYYVDVNVHPTKAEVRFRDAEEVRNFVSTTIRNVIRNNFTQTASTVASFTNDILQRKSEPIYRAANDLQRPITFITSDAVAVSEPMRAVFTAPQIQFEQVIESHPLGLAKCQIGLNYIIAEAEDGLILVDQHAAHERITLELMKAELLNGKVRSQILLIPEIVELSISALQKFFEHIVEIEKFGFVFEKHGHDSVLVRQVPEILQKENLKKFIEDLADYISENDNVNLVAERSDEILSNIACHGSIRSGRKMTIEEMNHLLRQIEKTAFSAQCNHGRPTFTKLTVKDLEKIFERA